MGISRIVRIRNSGVFRDFTWTTDLATFGRYNLIYGWNGSGKTTISKLLRALEMRSAPGSGEIILSINRADVNGHDFDRAVLPIRVFNRDFIAENVFPVGGGDVPPIFVVGKKSVEKQKEAEKLKIALANTESGLQSKLLTNKNAEKALDRYCIDRASIIKDTLRSSGPNPYNNYNKNNFQERTQMMAVEGDIDTPRLSDSNRQKLLTQHRAMPKQKLEPVTYEMPKLKPLARNVSQLLKTVVVSTVIQSLKDDQTLSAWIHRGLELHLDRHSEMCLYCEQALPKSRMVALEAHFSAEYEQFLKGLDRQISDLKMALPTANMLLVPNRAELHEDLAAEYEAALSSFRGALDSAKAFLESLERALTDKKGRPFEILEINIPVPDVDFSDIDRLNEIIQRHNQACDDFQTRISDARKKLEADFIASNLEEFLELEEEVKASKIAVELANAETKRLKREIARLEKEIVQHRKPADELNEDLRKYLDHDELSLEVRDTGYAITRNGAPADALSEGEMTAIALLYFLKTLQDRRFDLAKGVVVLDDPVSSLDANALYLAFGFIRERTKHAAQLIILTHNFTFFRQVRNWFHNIKGQGKRDVSKRPARFYMLDCARDGNQRCSSIRNLDPLLEKYESEYHYLFACIYRETKAATAAALQDNYMLPNMARRLLEAFLAFRQPQMSGQLSEKLNNIEFDEAKKLRILRFLHTHSHGDAIGEPEHDLSLLGEARPVLKDLLEFIKDQDPQHFSAMVAIVDPLTNEGNDE